MAERHDAYAALRNPDYRRLLSGGILASIAVSMVDVAVGWDLYKETGKAEFLGYAGLIQFIPVFLFALPAGQLADRFNRKWLFFFAEVLMAAACFGLATRGLLGWRIEVVYAYLFVLGLSRTLSAPARWSLVPMVVPHKHLQNAVTWNSSGWQLATVFGPFIAGAVMGVTKNALPVYLLAAACALACAGLIGTVHLQQTIRRSEPPSLRSLLAGAGFIWKTKPILAAITLDLFAVLFGGATALLPIFAKDIIGVNEVGFGCLRAAPSLGALGTAFLMAHMPPLKRAGPTLLKAVIGFGLATIVFGFSRNVALSFLMLALIGALDNVSVVVRGTLVQVMTPDSMRGRVASVNAVFIGSSNELGAFESGMTAAWFKSAPISVIGGGIGTILVVLAVMCLWPQLTRLGTIRKEPQPSESSSIPA
jgi:MFS family permease